MASSQYPIISYICFNSFGFKLGCQKNPSNFKVAVRSFFPIKSSVTTMNWNFFMRLQSVLNGGLEITMDSTREPDTVKIDTWGGTSWGSGIDPKLVKEKESQMYQAFDNNSLTVARQVLQSSLRSSARFVLPGRGSFFYKNPIFNKNGDVLCDITYNGLVFLLYILKVWGQC